MGLSGRIDGTGRNEARLESKREVSEIERKAATMDLNFREINGGE